MRGKILLVGVLLSGFFLSGCGSSDLDKLEGTWSDGEGNGFTFYAPDNTDETFGEVEMISNGNQQNGSYEWDESSQEIIITTIDKWGDTVYGTFEYELISDTELELTMTGYRDSVVATDNYEGEPVVFNKE